jgi:hypothetical protein
LVAIVMVIVAPILWKNFYKSVWRVGTLPIFDSASHPHAHVAVNIRPERSKGCW